MQRLRSALIIGGIATAIGVLFALHLSGDALLQDRPSAVVGNVVRGVTIWWLWALFAPAMVWCARRIHARPRHPVLVGALHLGAAATFSLAHSLIYVPFIIRVAWPELVPNLGPILQRNLIGNWYSDFFTYGAIVGAWSAWDYARRWRVKELEASRLAAAKAEVEGQLARAQLDGLRQQLNPHFLFNALNSASTLAQRGDAAAASRALALIGDLLRTTLELGAAQFVTLREELELVERFLAIERLRFEDRLAVEYRVDAAAEIETVPVLVLQPIVENALVHGIAHRPEGGTVTISASADGDRLVLTVEDEGPGPVISASAGTGIGLTNTRERLARLYHGTATLTMEPTAHGGTRTTVTLPRANEVITSTRVAS